MAKLHPLPQHKVIAILKKNGFKEARVRKHITMKKKIAKQTGKSIDEFYEK